MGGGGEERQGVTYERGMDLGFPGRIFRDFRPFCGPFFSSLRRQFRASIKRARAGRAERSRLNSGKYIQFYSAGKIFRAFYPLLCFPSSLPPSRSVREHVSLSGERQPRAAMDIRADLRNIRETRRRNNFRDGKTRVK